MPTGCAGRPACQTGRGGVLCCCFWLSHRVVCCCCNPHPPWHCRVVLCCSAAVLHAWVVHAAPVACLQRVAAEQALKTFQEHPDAWTRVDAILEKAKTQQTKYFALQVSTPSSAWGGHCRADSLQARRAALLCSGVLSNSCKHTHAYSSAAPGPWAPTLLQAVLCAAVECISRVFVHVRKRSAAVDFPDMQHGSPPAFMTGSGLPSTAAAYSHQHTDPCCV